MLLPQFILFCLQQYQKMGKRETQNIPLKYSKIDFDTRVQLISSVLDGGQTIFQASKMLGIKFSTAKLIVKRYKQSGYIFERRKDQEARMQNSNETVEVQSTSNAVVNSQITIDKSVNVGESHSQRQQKWEGLPHFLYYFDFLLGTFTFLGVLQ